MQSYQTMRTREIGTKVNIKITTPMITKKSEPGKREAFEDPRIEIERSVLSLGFAQPWSKRSRLTLSYSKLATMEPQIISLFKLLK